MGDEISDGQLAPVDMGSECEVDLGAFDEFLSTLEDGLVPVDKLSDHFAQENL
ncbi:hypothetical protein [Paracoccus tegillarcae]|uniref:hypothetical protein n=1 Tax=Paracoccus tegillarcae TaxID=1529068 RepID=UPI0013007E2A|nr:hypothetical protein [Paracoccus tegillarcae]